MERKLNRRKKSRLLANESGSVIIIVALLMTLFLGFVALAIDVGHLLVVRNELQNAADATALAGSSYLYPQNPSGLSLSPRLGHGDEPGNQLHRKKQIGWPLTCRLPGSDGLLEYGPQPGWTAEYRDHPRKSGFSGNTGDGEQIRWT